MELPGPRASQAIAAQALTAIYLMMIHKSMGFKCDWNIRAESAYSTRIPR